MILPILLIGMGVVCCVLVLLVWVLAIKVRILKIKLDAMWEYQRLNGISVLERDAKRQAIDEMIKVERTGSYYVLSRLCIRDWRYFQ